MAYAIDLAAVRTAHERIQHLVHRTAIATSNTVNQSTGLEVFFKPENTQLTGAFKLRGALNAILHLKETNPNCKGVVTHSSGNHGQALSYAAARAKIPCTVVVPENAPAVKVKGIRSHGAKVVLCEATAQARQETCDRLAAQENLTAIPSYNYPDVMSGQGTISLELLEQVPDLDAILVAISGGGLASGVLMAAKSIKPSVKVFIVEPKEKMLEECIRSGERLWPNPPRLMNTIADGMRIQQPGSLTWPIIRDMAEKSTIALEDEEIIAGMKFAFENMKMVVEPSGASTVAAVLSDRFKDLAKEHGLKRVAVIISGGNVDLHNLPW
eukprot:scpid52647/ scgid20127/ Probable serine racemase; D-serine ammonia-lyase; D-serine dehydratase; L-serine ammonia-lyase; L-serine dehydratase